MPSSLLPPTSVVSLSREQIFFCLISLSSQNIVLANSLFPEPHMPIITLLTTEGVEEKSLPKELLEEMRSYGTTSALRAPSATRSEKAEEEESEINNATKAAAGKAYEFASSVKDKLDGTAQKAKRVAEDEAEYPCALFLSPRSRFVPPSPRLSLCLSL